MRPPRQDFLQNFYGILKNFPAPQNILTTPEQSAQQTNGTVGLHILSVNKINTNL
jgi:hypothetical protein